MKKIWVPQLIACFMLLWAFNPDNPYGYYGLLRFVCCAVFVYLAVQASAQMKVRWVWVLGVVAVLYNPFFTVHLDREIWSVVNLLTIIIAVVSVFFLKTAGSIKEGR